MNLEQITASLLEQYPSDQRRDLQKRERYLERFGQLAFGGFGIVGAVAIIGLIYTIIVRMVLTGSNVWTGLLLAAFVAFAGLALSYVLLKEVVSEKRQKTNGPAPELAPAPNTGPLLEESHFEPARSVTEDTTHRLSADIISKTRKL